MDEEQNRGVSPKEDFSIVKDTHEDISPSELQVLEALKELKRVKEKYSTKEENKKPSE